MNELSPASRAADELEISKTYKYSGKKRSFNRFLLASASFSALLFGPSVLAANAPATTAPLPGLQTAAPPPQTGTLQEIIVTAQKRPERLDKASVAISVLTPLDVTTRGLTRINEVENMVPSARFHEEATAVDIYLRGIGSGNDFPYEPESVAFNLNNVYLPRFVTGGALFDVSSVEVLPGPQGVLYGRNAGGGAVVVQTARPTDELAGSAVLEGGNYGYAHGVFTENVPINDKLWVRAAGTFNTSSGYESNGLYADKSAAGRLSVLFKPTDDLSILVWANYNRDFGTDGAWQNRPYPDPNNPWYFPALSVQEGPIRTPLSNAYIDARATIVGSEVTYHFNDLTLTYLPGYVFYNAFDNRLIGNFRQPTSTDLQSYSNEFRLANDQSARFSWVTGLFQYHFNGKIDYVDGPDIPFIDSGELVENQEESYSAFVNTRYSVVNWARLIAGTRYSWDKMTVPEGDGEIHFQGVDTPFTFDKHWHNIDWKIGAEVDVAPRSMVYANIQTGYNEGTLSPQAGVAGEIRPQKLIAYTAGTKNKFLENRLQVNLEAFYYNYKNLILQQFDANSGSLIDANANKATIWGQQLDLVGLITPVDKVNVGIAYNKARVRDFFLNSSTNLSGRPLLNAPDVTLNAGFQHTWDFESGASVQFRSDTHFSSGYYSGSLLYSANLHQSPFTKTDMSLTYYSSNGRWSAALWVKNLENADVLTNSAVGGFPGPAGGFLEPPQSYGVRVAANW